jgi:integrase
VGNLFRQQTVIYRTPDGKRCKAGTPGAKRYIVKSKKWYWQNHGKREPLSESKETARSMLAVKVGEAERASVGLEDRFREHRDRPLTEHLEEFGRFLAGKGNVAEHVQRTVSQCRAVLAGCQFDRAGDLRESDVIDFLARLRAPADVSLDPRKKEYTVDEVAAVCGIFAGSVRRLARRKILTGEGKREKLRFSREAVQALLEHRSRGRGITTSNHYLVAIKAFSKWLVRDNRFPFDALAHMSRQNADVDRRRQRRALREEPFSRFIEATATGPAFRGLTGADRLVLYTLAANTGFRASELGSLSPSSFAFEATPATVTVRAGYSKHRREDVQPIRPDVAEMMRQYCARKPDREPLWPGTWTEAAAEMIRGDLAAVGIPYRDDAGRYFDFHAMRGQFISSLAAGGVHPKVAQTLARHSTINLTMDYYTHLDVFDVAGALDKLPGLPAGSERKASADVATAGEAPKSPKRVKSGRAV